MRKSGRTVCAVLTLTMLLALFALTTSPSPTSAQATQPSTPPAVSSPSNPLLAMLALAPDTADARAGGGQGVSYADYRAVESASGIAKPTMPITAMSKPDQTQYFTALRRVNAGPDIIQNMLLLDSTLNGFDWIDIDRAVQYGLPPCTATIFGGSFDDAKIGAALGAQQYEKTNVDGVMVWSRLQDGAFDISTRNPGDIFGGNLGAAARVALLPGYVANSRFTSETNDVISAYNGAAKSLADAPDYHTLADAITESPSAAAGSADKSVLVQAAFFPSAALTAAQPLNAEAMPNPPDVSKYGTLPPFSLAVLADSEVGQTQVNTVGVYYPDATTAKEALAELQKRIAGFDVGNFYETQKVTVGAGRVYNDDQTGMSVAIVSVSYPLPLKTPADGQTQPAPPGTIFRLWIDTINRRQFFPLGILTSPQP